MGKKITTDEYIKKAKLIHGELYGYNSVEYLGATLKVDIFCKKHSIVFSQCANDHLKGHGCPKCGNESTVRGISLSNEQFLTRAISIHSDKYDYGEVNYVNSRTKVKILCKQCKVYFFQKPESHLAGCGCTECGIKLAGDKRRKTTEQFIQEANEVHSNRYDYSKTNYTGNTTNIEILCGRHGIFKQIPTVHLRGGGCPKCSLIGRGVGFSRSGFIDKANGRICTFYTIRCFNREEEFYKIGRTMNSIISRYSGIVDMPYEYEVISEIKGSAGFIFDLERDEKRKLKALHYIPELCFGGSKTECFTDYKIQ